MTTQLSELDYQLLAVHDELNRLIYRVICDPDNVNESVRRENDLQCVAYQTAQDLLEARCTRLRELLEARREERQAGVRRARAARAARLAEAT